ncbi:MAG: AAA family ATPase [Candidatus Stygibacter frigidus]|nr:AAA family ATPase [Candidatus Stygibacter frigidus]
MKILKIRFENLNSLYGEWEIDFTTTDYTANGIFSITGPTGAGKSTILDAICLALYGRTPRLKSINKSDNQIMSRNTGGCFAEVTYETVNGKYRSIWSQHRARKKSDGSLQDARHEVCEADSGNILESQKRQVAAFIEAKTGMDFDRFTRSTLLAQGGFAAFLQANPDDRAPILEQITGTEIYSIISQKVHERHKTENDKLEILLAATSGIELLSPDDETALKIALKKNIGKKDKLDKEDKLLVSNITWLNRITELQKELTELEAEAIKAEVIHQNFAPEREKLRLANKAAEFDSEYATLSSHREQQKKETAYLKEIQQQIPTLHELLKAKEEQWQKVDTELKNIKLENEKELVLIKKVREHDIILIQKKKELDKAKIEVDKISQDISEKEKTIAINLSDQKTINQRLGSFAKYLLDNAFDINLTEDFTGIKVQIMTLKRAFIELERLEKNLKSLKDQTEKHHKAHKTLENNRNKLAGKAKTILDKITELEQLIEKLLNKRLLREYRAEYDSLLRELALINTIASMEDVRKKLEDGKPCPVCGSENHPYARGNIPEADETNEKINQLKKFIDKIEELITQKDELEKAKKEADLQLQESDKKSHTAEQKYHTAQYDYDKLLEDKKKSDENLNQLQISVMEILHKYGIKELPKTRLDAILTNLKDRQIAWQDMQHKNNQLNEELQKLQSSYDTLKAIHASLIDRQKENSDYQETCRVEYKELSAKRKELYGDKSPDEEELRLAKKLKKAEDSLETARTEKQNASDKINNLHTTITNLDKNIAIRKIDLEKLEPEFIAACKLAGFENENIFLSCKMPPADRGELTDKANMIDRKLTEISTRKCDYEGKLKIEKNRKLCSVSLEELQQKKSETDILIKDLSENIGAAKQKLKDNQAEKDKLKDKQKEIEAQKMELKRWRALHGLIGSADGKKFRNFAQGLTFEMMIAHANQQLARMSDRYLLVHDKANPLELNVIDNYQAGEERSTKNLSGGESFLVSLALALGLSQMASRKVQVDSLFLDEGFGTLDEEALETALESLANLQQSGKLIGIISHVPALKERISTQIKVSPLTGGKSKISGPGIIHH